MKFNKWTVALAAAGVVSLTTAAMAEEKPSSVLTALSGTTISGTVDTSMEWNPGAGAYNVPPYKFNSPSMANGFNLDVVQLTIEKPLDETDWAAGYRADLWFGPYANQLGTQSILSSGASDFAIRQAYVALRAPIGNGLDFKVGVFDSIIGYESVDASKDPNFTRSYGHTIEPQTETGVLMSYRFCDFFSASAGVANTIGPQINQRSFITPLGVPPVAYAKGPDSAGYEAWMGSVALTAPDSWGFLGGSTLYGGGVNGYNAMNYRVAPLGVGKSPFPGANVTSWYVGSTIATPLKALRLGAAWDWLDIHQWPGRTWAIGGYASFQATEKLSFHARAEYLDDSAHFLFPAPTSHVLDLTATVQYDLWKNVITRVEFRWDHSLNDSAAFGGTSAVSGPTLDNAYMLGANIIYRF
ncbi:MAG TPA: outer membrane beta-barrel protein [Candidatus Acidoferrum sp.]|nr:outer membrane beta-barrel protein [Candidatus Acidoferrum sp.]